LLSLTAAFQPAIAQDRGNTSAQEYGDAVYRELDGLAGFAGYDYNHTAIFSGLDSVHEEKVRQALGSGTTTQEAYFSDEFTSYGTGYYGAYTLNNRTMSFTDRKSVVKTASDLVNAAIPYPDTFFGLVAPVCIVYYGSTFDGSVADISNIRCDGFVEYCYEYNGFRVWRNQDYIDADWSIVLYPDLNNNRPDITRNPEDEASPWAQRGAPCATGPQVLTGGCSYLAPDTKMTSAAVINLPTYQVTQVSGNGYVDVTVTATDESGIHYIGYERPGDTGWSYSPTQPQDPTSSSYSYTVRVTSSGTFYTFAVDNGGNYPQYANAYTVTVSSQSPSMSLSYNGTAILNGDTSPSVAKGTDFGTTSSGLTPVSRTFTISDTGNGALNLTGAPRVQLGGNNPSDFGVTALPSTPVPANGGSTTFQLVFQPTANTGLQSATVTIANDDPNKNPYTFKVQGTAVTQPRVDPSLEYNGVESLNGDQSPTVSKGTDFGSVNVGSQSSTHSFRFYNYGTIDMTLTGSLVQLSGANSGDFAIVSMPSSPIAPNQYSTIGIRFQPTGSGLRTVSVLIYFDATYGLGATSPYTVALQGTGIQNTVSVTVQPNPLSGPSYSVDGSLWYGATPFNWNAGDSHTISTTTPQNIGNPIITKRFVWSSWSDGGAISHTVAPTTGTTYTANFNTQYFLQMATSAGGIVSPSSDWYNSGMAVPISATPNNGYKFTSWTGSGSGSYSGNNNPASVTMNESITEIPSFALIPVPTISNPKLTGTTFTLSVPTQVGFSYVLEYKNSLTDANWTPVQTLGGTGGMITLTNTTTIGPSRFYHVRVQ
jgi:hypothetical protein